MSDVSAGHREEPRRGSERHPIEDHLAERFEFLDERQHTMVVQIVKGYPVGDTARVRADLEDLIADLALHIDAEAEWVRIERMSSDQVIAELAAAGVSDLDVSAGLERLGANLLARGIDISPEAREARFRQQERWLSGLELPPAELEAERAAGSQPYPL